MVLGAAGGEYGDDVLDPAAADVRDIGLHVRAHGARPGRAVDALLKPGRQPRQVEVAEHRRVLQVMPFVPDSREAQHRKLAGGEPPLQRLEVGRGDAAVCDAGLDAVAFAQRAGELAQAPDPLADTITCSSAATPASVWALPPRNSGSPSPPPRIASPTSPWRTSAVASAAFEWVSVSGSTLASTKLGRRGDASRLAARSSLRPPTEPGVMVSHHRALHSHCDFR